MNEFHPFLALVALAKDPSGHAPGLPAFVRRLLNGDVYTRFGTPVRVPEHDRDDVAQDVLCKLVDQAPQIVARLAASNPTVFGVPPEQGLASGDPLVTRYVQVMLAHRWIDAYKRRKAGSIDDLAPDEVPRVEMHAMPPLDLARRAMERARQDAHAAFRHETDAVQFDSTYAQLLDLALGMITMEALLDAERAGDPELAELPAKKARERVQARLYKRHERVRTALLGAAERIGEAGPLAREEAEMVRSIVKQLLTRRQIPAAGASEGKGKTG